MRLFDWAPPHPLHPTPKPSTAAAPELRIQHGPSGGLHSYQSHFHRMCCRPSARRLLHTRHQEVAAAGRAARLAPARGAPAAGGSASGCCCCCCTVLFLARDVLLAS